MAHVLGLGTLAAQLITAGFVGAYLVRSGREPRSWRRAPKAPKFASGTVSLSSDWTGLV